MCVYMYIYIYAYIYIYFFTLDTQGLLDFKAATRPHATPRFYFACFTCSSEAASLHHDAPWKLEKKAAKSL